jgi:hypothetical protein
MSMHLLPTLRGAALIVTFACFFTSAASTKDSFTKHPKATFSFDQLWNLEKTFWDAFLYPANLKQTQGNASTIFASDVS